MARRATVCGSLRATIELPHHEESMARRATACGSRLRNDDRLRCGYGLPELIVSVVVGGWIATLATSLVIAQARLLAHGSLRVESLDAMRTASLLMPLEARALSAPDVHAVAADSAALRAFRGMGLVCDTSGGRATLRYRGWRDPDATKDSALIATRAPESVGRITFVVQSATACTTHSGEVLVDVAVAGDTLAIGEVVLVFEPGAYHLSGAALRYRAPGGTRQPLTADVLGGPGFDLLMRAPPALAEPLALDLDLAPVQRAARFASSQRNERVRVLLLNTSSPPDSTE